MAVRTIFALLLSLNFATLPLLAKDRPFLDEPDNTIREDFAETEWKEGQISLPQSYSTNDLQEFHVDDASSQFRYFIDRSSLKVYEDGVSRFILVIRSNAGVENSSYEGLHCGEREYKIYAFGNHTGFKALANPTWQHISRSGRENYRNVLYSNLICNLNTGKPNPPQKVFQAMQKRTSVDTFLFNRD